MDALATASAAPGWCRDDSRVQVDSTRLLPCGYNRHVKDLPLRTWREVATDWKVWLSLALCLIIATIAWLMEFD